MKATNFLFMAVLGVGLAMSSCNNEVIVDGENNQGSGSGDGFMSMTLQFPEQGASTYAEEAGTGNEITVSAVTVVFFDTTTNIVSEVVELSSATVGDLTTSGTKVKTKAMKIDKKGYDVVVLVNRPSALAITKGSTTKTNFETAANVVLADLTGSAGFFMTNATSYKRVISSNFQPTETAATDIPVPLKVERAVAKIVVSKGSSMSVTGGTVADASIKWAADVKNKQLYWMRKQTNKLEYVAPNWVAGAMETEADYTSDGREYLYAEDPNFTGHSATETGLFDRIAVSNITRLLDSVEYVPENTMQDVDQFRNVSTSVVIELAYAPTGISDAITVGYYMYNGTPISDTDMKAYDTDHNSIPSSLPGLGDLLDEYAPSLTTTPSASFTYKSLSFYKNGLSYFNVPIKHFKNQTTLMAYGRYGVVRNNVYKLTINSIKGPGKTEPSPEDWEDDEESYISVEFEIMPWYVRDQGIDL